VSHKTRIRLSLERAYASPIQIFLPRRSRVELYRDGRLLTSGIPGCNTYSIIRQNSNLTIISFLKLDYTIEIINTTSASCSNFLHSVSWLKRN